MSKTVKRVLIALAVLLLVGGCFGAVAVYAHRELTKPVFSNDDPKIVSVEPLPTDAAGVLSYMQRLYETAVNADDVEVSWHTDVKRSGYDTPMETPFGEADEKVIAYILKQAGDQIRDQVYPQGGGVLESAKNGAFVFDITDADVLDFSAEQGRYNDHNEYVDDEYYFISLTVDPAWLNAGDVPQGEAFARLKEALSSAFTVQDAQVEGVGARLSFKVARMYNELVSMEITRSYHFKADLLLQDDFAALSPDGPAVTVEAPYEATEKYSFYYYGAHFTQRWLAVQPGDWQAIPARVQVHAEELPENYKMTYTVSAPDIVSIDADGVMRVESKGVEEQTVIVGMTLEYDGHVYSDEIPVYITKLEVKTDV